MKRLSVQLILVCICNSSHKLRPRHQNTEELYRSHVFSHYLNSENSFLQPVGRSSDDSDAVNNRDVKLSDGGLFYHDGPYVSHSQVQREAPHFESYVTPLPEVYKTDPVPPKALFGRIQPQTSANPYTYAVHAVSVTPSPYLGPSTPLPYHAPVFSQSNPSPYYGPSSPSYEPNPQTPRYGPSTPAPYYGALPPVSYNGQPTPVLNHVPPSPPLFYGLSYNVAPTPPPYQYQGSPSPSYGSQYLHQKQEVAYHDTPLYQHPTPEYDSSINIPVKPKPNFYIHEQVHHSTSKPSFNVPSIPNPYNHPPMDFHKAPAISFFDSPSQPSHHPSPGSHLTHENNHLNQKTHHHQKLSLSPEQPAALPHQARSLFSNLVNDQQTNMPLTIQKERKQQPNKNTLSNPNQQHSLGLQLFSQDMQEPRQQKSIQLKTSVNELQTNDIHEPTQIKEIPPAQQTLFQSINQEAADRPVHQKLTQQKSQHKMPKSDALQRLMSIAGDDWDMEIGIEKNLLDTSSSSFICPGPEGDFPSPSSCSVYYQCAQGTPHKHTCEAGLRWNMDKNQCDWEHNVDCDRNKSKKNYYY